MLLYVSKLSEYAHDVAGQGKQHVGVPGKASMGAQNRPAMTGRRQFDEILDRTLSNWTYILPP